MMRRSLSSFLLTSFFVAGLACVASDALAKPKIAAEVDFAVPVLVNGAKPGAGGALRGGYELNVTIVHVMPEVGVGFHKLTDDGGPSIFRGFVGGRAGLGDGVRFDGFLHIGYGNIAYGATPVGGGDSSFAAPILDGGLALDFTLIPAIDLGIHASYNTALNRTGTADTPRWIGLGAQLAIVF